MEDQAATPRAEILPRQVEAQKNAVPQMATRGSKSRSIIMKPRIKMSNFTAEINLFTARNKT